jgi:hypothetical protein
VCDTAFGVRYLGFFVFIKESSEFSLQYNLNIHCRVKRKSKQGKFSVSAMNSETGPQ